MSRYGLFHIALVSADSQPLIRLDAAAQSNGVISDFELHRPKLRQAQAAAEIAKQTLVRLDAAAQSNGVISYFELHRPKLRQAQAAAEIAKQTLVRLDAGSRSQMA